MSIPWHEEMYKAIKRPTDRIVFRVYFVRFEEVGSAGTVHRFLLQRYARQNRKADCPCRGTIYQSIRRLNEMAANYRPSI